MLQNVLLADGSFTHHSVCVCVCAQPCVRFLTCLALPDLRAPPQASLASERVLRPWSGEGGGGSAMLELMGSQCRARARGQCCTRARGPCRAKALEMGEEGPCG